MNEPVSRDELGREETIFNAAVQLHDPAKRAIYLDLACENNAALRARIEKLLASDAGDVFFAPPLAKPVVSSRAAATPAASGSGVSEAQAHGERIGRYRLLQKIGEGGCGIVYMAEQEEPVRRRVALKIIKLGMDTRQVIARFEAERQALAMMDHPNIAKILDGGVTETGRPYFVMDLVQGLPIIQFCDEAQLPTCQRLDLFLQVCSAIQHAHQKGIIHRDIKPSNILVTLHGDKPVPKVIDFGIAKATQQRLTDKTLFTQFQHFIGTPAYMSPEQASLSGLDIDTRSDIYSLGVLLYELLTGKTPFDSKELLQAGVEEMCRTIREEEPARPSTRLSTLSGGELTTTAKRRGLQPTKLISLLRGDLDWIVMKCLEKDRARRYDTANGLAMDIQRHLNSEPVIASQPSTFYRFHKLVRRNRGAFGAAFAILSLLILGAGVSTWEAIRARRAGQEQVRLRQDAERAQANEARERAKAQTEATKSSEVARVLEDMLDGAAPSVALGRDATILIDILDKTTERVQTDLKNQPEVQGDLNARLAASYRDLGDLQKGELLQERAVDDYRAAFSTDHPKLARALGKLGYTQTRRNNNPVGRETARLGLEMARRCGDPKTLANCLSDMARTLDQYLCIPEQEPYYREAIDIEQRLGDDPVALANYTSLLACCLSGRRPEAESLYRKAIDLHRQHLGKNHPKVEADLYMLAQCLRGEDKSDEAKETATAAVELGRRILRKDHDSLRLAIALLSDILITRDEWTEAEVLLRRAVAEAPASKDLLIELGFFEARRGHWEAAADAFSRATKIDPNDFGSATQLAIALLRLGQVEDYRRTCHQLLEQFADAPIGTAHVVAKTALILPVDGADFGRACQLADFAATAKGFEPEMSWYALPKALADLRRGRFDSAQGWAHRATTNINVPRQCKAAGLFIESLAYSSAHRDESAKAALAFGEQWVKECHPNPNDFGSWPIHWAIADSLHNEARKQIYGDRETTR
jgi:serine/threonine protein kinase/tetratricopeptide (TPR) repeat protein